MFLVIFGCYGILNTLNEIKRNYWADGFDMYSMQYNEL